MRAGLYFRLAGGNIRKNGKVYFPYILTCVCMISIFYITAFLARDPGVRAMSCLLYTSPSPRDAHESRMPSSA